MANLITKGFNLRREAAPNAPRCREGIGMCKELFQSQTRSRSTCDTSRRGYMVERLSVSISDEKPLHMRQQLVIPTGIVIQYVSISDEKPLHMRQRMFNIPCCIIL